MRIAIVLVFALMFAGCTESGGPEYVPDDEDPQSTTPPKPNGTQDPAVIVEQPPVKNTTASNVTVGGLKFSASGPGGSWVVGFIEFPEAIEGLRMSSENAIQTSGPTFYVAPTTVRSEIWDFPRLWPFDTEHLKGEGINEVRRGSSSVGGASYGLFFALASEGPWSLDLDYVWDEDGEQVLPTWLSTGTGAEFGMGADSVVPTGAAGGSMTYDATISGPGWTHAEIVNQPVQPVTVQEVEFVLGGGHTDGGTGYQYGYFVPMAGGSASSAGRIDYVGNYADDEGDLSVSFAGVDVSSGMDIGHVFIPVKEMPPGMSETTYSGSTWPFA